VFFLFTKSVRELNEKSSIEAIQDEYEKKSVLLQSGSLSSPSTMVLEKEIEFLKKTASILKEYKVKGFN